MTTPPQTSPHRDASPNQAVYEQITPNNGPLGLQNGPYTTQGNQVIALHENGDGSVSGVAADGTTVHIG